MLVSQQSLKKKVREIPVVSIHHVFLCKNHNKLWSSAPSRFQVKLPTQESDQQGPSSNHHPEGKHSHITWAPPPRLQDPIAVDKGSPRLCRTGEGVKEEQHPLAGWRGPADWCACESSRATYCIAQRRIYCAVHPSCRFMLLRPAWGLSYEHTVNLTPVKTKLRGWLWMLGWQVGLSAFLGIKKKQNPKLSFSFRDSVRPHIS